MEDFISILPSAALPMVYLYLQGQALIRWTAGWRLAATLPLGGFATWLIYVHAAPVSDQDQLLIYGAAAALAGLTLLWGARTLREPTV